ncbi:zinc finger protein [[Candida] jaroonii]|uniref:Zinc finger protein n=1 Tax=[Candida] jaroonii TaxID=467808 RepID=A0ACA9Y374_9ASCO|nr:zinc finger protein [[Candida] jaroonii]
MSAIENSTENSESDIEDMKRKSKKRNLGNFPCPDCGKIFTRTDHLSRHYLNHKPKEVFECEFPVETIGGGKRKCGKRFVRRDLKDRHLKRHLSSSPNVRVNWSSLPSDTSTEMKDSPESAKTFPRTNSIADTPINIPHKPASIGGESPLQISNLINNNESNLPIFDRSLMNKSSNFNSPGIENKAIFSRASIDSKSNFMPSSADSKNSSISLADLPPGLKPMVEHISNGDYNTQMNKKSLPTSNMPNSVPSNVNYNLGPETSNDFFQSQTDILSWLFTDSPPINNGYTRIDGSVMQVPSIVNSPNADNQMNSIYELHDNNIFQYEMNPLDEVMLRNYNQSSNKMQPVKNENEVTTEAGSRSVFGSHFSPLNELTPFNYSVPSSSISMNSPTNTNESNPTPKSINDLFSPNINNQQKRLHEYGIKYNIAKNDHIHIDKIILSKVFEALPSLSKSQVELYFNDKILVEDRFSYYLSIYWLVFHPQFNFLHKPSFKTSTAEPLLLFSMILVGCNYCTNPANLNTVSSPRFKSSEYKLALNIAVPLRYAIFEHEDFKSPVKLWILQSLNLLEWSEKNFLSRKMHERAHVHHASTVQLMRRSPVFGGNPGDKSSGNGTSGTHIVNDENDNEDLDVDSSEIDKEKKKSMKNDMELFKKWVESESMKRITFMTFYLDIADYVKFRHNPVILFHQLQIMKLPCNDELWEASDVNNSFIKILKKQKKFQSTNVHDNNLSNERFLTILKKLLNNNANFSYHLSPFVKKILYGGLISVMYEMQQFELQNTSSLISIPNSKGNFQVWKELLTTGIENFGRNIKENCTQIALNKDSTKFIDCSVSTCKFPIYHITQIVGMPDLNTYDGSIYCGSPANQNVKINAKDRLIVERKLSSLWLKPHQSSNINDIVNLKSIVHCYIFLWETLLADNSPLNKVENEEWSPDKDYFDAIFGISIAMETLWSYCYLTSGIESSRYNDIQNIEELNYLELIESSVETGYEYLSRIKQEFLFNLKRHNLHHSHSIENLYNPNSEVSPHEILVKYCEILPKISNKQNISGLCFLVGAKLYNNQWFLVRENGKLIIHCGLRSIGKKEVICHDLFDVELKD